MSTNNSSVDPKERESLLYWADLIRTVEIVVGLSLIATAASLAWGNRWSLILVPAAIALVAGLASALPGEEPIRKAQILGDLKVSYFREGQVFIPLAAFLVAALVHMLWWSDHLVRMLQIYCLLGAGTIGTVASDIKRRIASRLGITPRELGNRQS